MGALSRGIQALDFVPSDSNGGIISASDFGGVASTGETITPEAALNVSAYWRGVNLISNSVAVLPLKVFRRVNENAKEAARDHPLWPLLHDEPNPEMDSFTFRQTMTGHVVGWGNGFAEIERNGFNQPLGLWPLRPDRMTLEREVLSLSQIARNVRPRKRWKYLLPDGTAKYFAPSEVLHFKGLGFDGDIGYPVLTLMRHTLGVTRALDQYAGNTFKYGARPSVVLTHPQHLSEKARTELAQDWTEKYGGLNNMQRVAVLEEGIQVQTIGFAPEDAQFLASRQFQVLEFSRWLGVPPHKLYDLDRATFSNIEQQALEYLTDSVNPWLVAFEMQMQRSLFSDDQYFAEFDRNALMQVDARSRAIYYQTLRWLGAINADYIADRENAPRPPDGLGEDYYIPMNMQKLGAPALTTVGAAPAPQEEAAVRFELLEMSERIEALEHASRNGSTPK